VQIDLGSLCRFMAEPESDHTEVHTATEQGHGGRVPKGVGRHLLRRQ
jgi:hypothetical protein